MYTRMLKLDSSHSYFLLGPRATGKSHWLRAHYPEAIYLDLLQSDLFNELLAHPSKLEHYIPKSANKKDVLIDEIQKVPALLDEVHRLIENKNIRFILTGSSARKLRRQGVNLLAGRARLKRMFPLTGLELGKDFDLQKSLKWGQLPIVYSDNDPEQYLQSYVQTYLKEEVQQEGLVRNLSSFARFLEIASLSQASPLNISEISRECHVERKVVENYFTILEDLLLAIRLPAFTKRAKRRVMQHPKFFYFDVGVYRALRPKGPLDSPQEIEGSAYETLFFQELRAINEYQQLGFELYYWRTSNGQEVDFIAYGEKGLFAFEVKRKAQVTKKDLTGLKAFKKDYPMAHCYLVCGSQQDMEIDGIAILNFEKVLLSLESLLCGL